MENYFRTVNAKILDNNRLRNPQKYAYTRAYNHYMIGEKPDREVVIVLPTGVGKTGLIAILPFGISNGKVLILTPQLTIKDGILKNLTGDMTEVDNFYSKYEVLNEMPHPQVAEYRKELPKWIYDKSNIIVANIHKVQERLDKSLINTFPSNYFDMIIIDEAHHSAAKTWTKAIEYFSSSKVIKLTATPFRTDKEAITGKEIFNYPLSSAMSNSYIKSLQSITYIPEKLYLTIDGNLDTKYSIQEILDLKLKDEEWISRSVAYSKECSEQIVEKSIELLNEKKSSGKIPHKIIAIACSVEHAEEIKSIYEEKGKKVAILHSKLSEEDKKVNFEIIESNDVDVVLNVAMLGEGYDHKYLSIAAIFRPFRNILPYTQFIGRILRFIPEGNPVDNIGSIIAHENLNLKDLWEYYRAEIEKSNIVKELQKGIKEGTIVEYFSNKKENIDRNDIGRAFEEGDSRLEVDVYLDTELIQQAKKDKEEEEKNIKELQRIMNFKTYEMAKSFYQLAKAAEENNGLNRPDLLFMNNKQFFNAKITDEIIPEILQKTKHDIHKRTLEDTELFKKYPWILSRARDNGGILAIFINTNLVKKVKKKREEWNDDDFVFATKYLEQLQKFLEENIIL